MTGYISGYFTSPWTFEYTYTIIFCLVYSIMHIWRKQNIPGQHSYRHIIRLILVLTFHFKTEQIFFTKYNVYVTLKATKYILFDTQFRFYFEKTKQSKTPQKEHSGCKNVCFSVYNFSKYFVAPLNWLNIASRYPHV